MSDGFGAPSAQIVTFADVAADQQFFFEHPERRYRLSDRWAVRRRGGVFLRTPLPAGHRYVDTGPGAEHAWWECAWPELAPKTRSAMIKAARRGGRIFTGKQ